MNSNLNYKNVYICKNCKSFLFRFEDLSKIKSGDFDFTFRKINIFSEMDSIMCGKCKTVIGNNYGSIKLYNNEIIEIDSDEFGNYFQEAIFAAGCFWGVDYHFKREKGVIYTSVGYTGGKKPYPTYEEVKKGSTGHKEAIHVLFDPKLVTYEELVRVFFEIHDFTQTNGQGPDIGSQYLSYIYYFNDYQRDIAEYYVKILRAMGYKVATKIEKAKKFWRAEDYHQDYYDLRGEEPYCHIRKKIFK